MCSVLGPNIMENYQGDLTDIVRASGGAYGGTSSSSSSYHDHHQQHPWLSSSSTSSHEYPPAMNFSGFGDPFSTMRDPFLQELDMPNYFNSSSGGLLEEAAAAGFGATPGNISKNNLVNMNVENDDHHRRAAGCKNIFSNMIQISPNAIKPSSNSSSSSIINNSISDSTQLQISSPRNPGLKRRKNQAKKVVCIPAPAAANSRQSGEVVPSDLWAWRKYGQKPIKGSPYPRGYYRCSSSKGCSARKQVERSRTDPNMLVITYTSEHNHPWPTQRNALAGSTRSQPNSKTNSNNAAKEDNQKGNTTTKEELLEERNNIDDHGNNSNVTNNAVVAGSSSCVKEENILEEKVVQVVEGDDDDDDQFPYKPSMNNHEDFFADLGEIEADPLSLLFTTQGFAVPALAPPDHHLRESKGLDPFHLFDWSSGDTNNSNIEEPHHQNNKRRL